MSTHLKTTMPNSGGNDFFCGWKHGLSWGEKLSEKGSVKQTISIRSDPLFFLQKKKLFGRP